MNNPFIFKKNSISVIVCSTLLLLMAQDIYAQQYPEMKIILKNSATIEGEDGILNDESASLLVNNESKTYPLEDVQMVMVKKGLAGKYALWGGGGCAVINLIVIIASSGMEDETGGAKYETSTLVAGSLIWVGICAGGGYLIGSSVDDWNTIYTASSQSSLLDRFKLGFGSSRKGEFRIGLSYNF